MEYEQKKNERPKASSPLMILISEMTKTWIFFILSPFWTKLCILLGKMVGDVTTHCRIASVFSSVSSFNTSITFVSLRIPTRPCFIESFGVLLSSPLLAPPRLASPRLASPRLFSSLLCSVLLCSALLFPTLPCSLLPSPPITFPPLLFPSILVHPPVFSFPFLRHRKTMWVAPKNIYFSDDEATEALVDLLRSDQSSLVGEMVVLPRDGRMSLLRALCRLRWLEDLKVGNVGDLINALRWFGKWTEYVSSPSSVDCPPSWVDQACAEYSIESVGPARIVCF